MQYSVFHFEGSAAQMGRLMADIEARIDRKRDDVRGYRLPQRLNLETIGRGALPGAVFMFSAVSPPLQTLLQVAGN